MGIFSDGRDLTAAEYVRRVRLRLEAEERAAQRPAEAQQRARYRCAWPDHFVNQSTTQDVPDFDALRRMARGMDESQMWSTPTYSPANDEPEAQLRKNCRVRNR